MENNNANLPGAGFRKRRVFMRISTKGRYALRLMLDLATNDSGSPIRLKDAARRQNISEKYLEQIISILNKAGYVRSIRGPQGGYVLSHRPEEYTVGMILRLTEGSLFPVACMDDEVNVCTRCDSCEPLDVWKQIADAINNIVDNVTIADLLEKKKNRNKGSGSSNME